MIDPDAFAALLCDWCLEVEPRQQVLLGATTLAAPLVRALHRALLDRDAWPLMRLTPAGDRGRLLPPRAAMPHLDGFAPLELTEIGEVDARARDRRAGEHARARRRRPGG